MEANYNTGVKIMY